MRFGEENTYGVTESVGIKPVLLPFCPQERFGDRSRTSAVRNQGLTSWRVMLRIGCSKIGCERELVTLGY